MTRLRQTAERVQTLGVERRGQWDPEPNSAHFKLYSWWVNSTGKHREQENFCHYWRVVAIWAPLRWLTTPLRNRKVQVALMSLAGAAVLALVAFIALSFLSVTQVILGIAASAAYLVLGIAVVLQLLARLFPRDWGHRRRAWFDSRGDILLGALVLLTLPIVLVTAVLAITIGALVVVISALFDEYRLYRWLVDAHPPRLPWLRPVTVAAAVGIVFLWMIDPIIVAFIGTLVAIFVFAAVAALAAGWAEERYKERRDLQLALIKKRREREIDLLLRRVFAIYHPLKATIDARLVSTGQRPLLFERWLVRYKRWASWRFVDFLDADEHLRWVGLKYYALYGGAPAPARPAKIRYRRRRLRSFIQGARDFFHLFWQWAVARKRSICPLISLPETADQPS